MQLTQEAKIASVFLYIRAIFAFVGFVSALGARRQCRFALAFCAAPIAGNEIARRAFASAVAEYRLSQMTCISSLPSHVNAKRANGHIARASFHSIYISPFDQGANAHESHTHQSAARFRSKRRLLYIEKGRQLLTPFTMGICRFAAELSGPPSQQWLRGLRERYLPP